jgi:hypothetical protein
VRIGWRTAATPPEENIFVRGIGGKFLGIGIKADGVRLSRDQDEIAILSGGQPGRRRRR